MLVAIHGVAEPFCARQRAKEEEQEGEPKAIAAFEGDRL